MHNLKEIRDHPEVLDAALIKRGGAAASEEILALDAQNRQILTQLQEKQSERNAVAKKFGQAKAQGQNVTEFAKQAEAVKADIAQLEKQAATLGQQLTERLARLPNLLDADVPEGADESDNVLYHEHGKPPSFSFQPKAHYALGEQLGLMDFERAAKMSGSRFVVLSGLLARLERALAQFMLDIQTSVFGYQEISPPLLVLEQTMFGTAQLPKFQEDQFETKQGLWLIPTAEVVLTNLVREEILNEKDLPLRFTAYTHCFRAEAGAAGKDTRGMVRQHQFGKVELVSITTPEASEVEHQRMLGAAEEILKRLGLAYRVVTLCSGDVGFAARKTYDIEVWVPSEDRYREISSCSNCGDFQARRMKARYRPQGDSGGQKSKPAFVHTLNGSGLAVGRTLLAVMENYQKADGSIEIPEALRPYIGGLERIQTP